MKTSRVQTGWILKFMSHEMYRSLSIIPVYQVQNLFYFFSWGTLLNSKGVYVKSKSFPALRVGDAWNSEILLKIPQLEFQNNQFDLKSNSVKCEPPKTTETKTQPNAIISIAWLNTNPISAENYNPTDFSIFWIWLRNIQVICTCKYLTIRTHA